MIANIVGKLIGKCIDDGHNMHYTHYTKDFGYIRNREYIHFKCSRCGYTTHREANQAEQAAIQTLKNAKHKDS